MPEKTLVVLGMEAVGKSLLVRRLREKCGMQSEHSASAQVPATTPTIGVEMDTLVTTKPHPRHVFEVREIGGVMVQLWQNYFEECGLLIFVLDMAQAMQISSSCVELYRVLSDERMRSVPVLLFLNKMDLDVGFTRSVVDQLLRLQDLQATCPQKLEVVEGSAAEGSGVDQVLDWMISNRDNLLSA